MSVVPSHIAAIETTGSSNEFYDKFSIRYHISILSYDAVVIQWITSCHINRMTTRYITLGYWLVTS